MLKLAVVGSRNFKRLFMVDEILTDLLKKVPCLSIISGGARGVDQRAYDWANKHGVECEVIEPLDYDDKFSYLLRNVEIITKADIILAFWNGKSRGTKFVIDYATKRHKYLKIIKNEEKSKNLAECLNDRYYIPKDFWKN